MRNRPKPPQGILAILVLLLAGFGFWFWKQARESAPPDSPEPAQITESSLSGSSRDPLVQNANPPSKLPQSGIQVESAFGAFEDWMERYLNADPGERDQLTEEGLRLVQRRRSVLKSLIQEDPEAALALAIPYELRRELPAAIIELLETPVSDYASYKLEVHCLDPSHGSGGYERLATIEESHYKVFTHGRRLDVTTKERLSLHGMAIDEVLAMGEDPIRVLLEAERLDRGFNSPRVVAVGNNFYEWADETALDRLRQNLRQDETVLGPRPGAVHWKLRRGEVEGITLLLAEDAIDWLEDSELPEMQSAHTEGPKTMLYIRARFSDQDADHEPIDLETLKERQAGCEAFWHENSYGKSSLTTTFTDTITLPNPTSHYADRESEHLKTLFEDALPLARSAGVAKRVDWNATNYDFYTLLTSGGDFDYGGRASVGGRGSHLNGSGAARVRTASHEFGHNLGLFHANYWRTDSTSPIGRDSIPGGYVGDEEGDEWIEYGHKFSVMSGQRGSGDLNEGRGHYTTGEKVKLDWLVSGDGDWVSVNRTTATPIRLYRQDVESDDFGARLKGVARAIKINVDSGDYAATEKRRYWLSYRRLPTNGIAEDWLPYGLQIDWQQETYGKDGSIQLDMTPYSRDDHLLEVETDSDNQDKEDAVVLIGRTYSDEVADIHFTPIAQGGGNPNEWIDVLINIGAQDGNTDPEITSFTASSTDVDRNWEAVEFLVDAVDADGDKLYYGWSFGDGEMMAESLNSNRASKIWNSPGVFTVRATVFDGKGGSDAKEIHIKVGPLGPITGAAAIMGRVIAGGFPVQGVRVVSTEYRKQAWTDGEGRYALFNLATWGATVTAAKAGMRFEPLFDNPVRLGTDVIAFGKDWVAIGDGPASGSLQLAVTPYYTEVPLRGQIAFRALAWDASGKRIDPDPVWSVSGGGTISESGLFTATEIGGSYTLTARQGTATAQASFMIEDAEVIGIIALTPQVSEPGLEDAIFRIKRYGSAEQRLRVNLKWEGTASAGEDYTQFDYVRIPAGETYLDFKIDILDDSDFEPIEELILKISPNNRYAIYSEESSSASIEILDDSDGAPIIHLTSPRQPLAILPDGAGLYLETIVEVDESLPHHSNEVSVSWSVLDAPEGGAVTFSPPQGLATVATFDVPGFYRIQISANDGVKTRTSEIPVYAGLIPGSPSSDDEIVYLAMDEGEGITATDSRGGDNNGALINGASWTGPGGGASGTGIVLDGIDDEIHIESTDQINLPGLRQRTIALWFKAYDPLRKSRQALYEEGGLTSGFKIFLDRGRLYVRDLSSGVNGWHSYFSMELVDTNWHHVALVLNVEGSNNFQNNVFKVFLDGREFGSAIAAAQIGHEGNITIGANRNDTRYGGPFAGIVDEFHLWNRALSHLELGLLFNKAYIGPELTLSSVDYASGSVVIPSETGIFLDGDTPGSSPLETRWETLIAPEGGEAIFENPIRPSTYATLPTPGYYKLRLSADDGQQKSAIDVDVHAGNGKGSNLDLPGKTFYFSMNEGSGEIAGNSADENYPGNLSHPSGWTSEGGGISGTAIQFDGIDDVLIFEEGSPLESPSEKKSFALWIKPHEIGTGQKEVIFKVGEIANGFNIYLDGNMLFFGGWNNSQFSWETFLSVPITRGKWHHLALVLDAGYSGLDPDGLRAYLDGRQVAAGLASGMDSYIRYPSLGRITEETLFHDGPPQSNISYAFSGIIDEFHAYNDHALTIDEIGRLYAFGNVGPTVDAGPDQWAVPTHTVLLAGSSTDDERWSSPVQYSWDFVDRPGAGTFSLLEDDGSHVQLDLFAGGSYRIALRADDGQVTTFDELIVTVEQPTYFDLFMDDYPAIALEDKGYDSDPDGDSRTNLAEYAMGGAPDVNETYFQLGLQYQLVSDAGNWYAEFRYPRRQDAALRGLRYQFQVSDDLSTDSWMDRGYTVLEINPIDEIFEEVRLRIDQPLSSLDPGLFGRVKIYLDE